MRYLFATIWFWGLCLTQVFGQTIEVTANDLLRFNPATLEVKSGASVTLVFKNSGRIASQKHQFILLKAGVDEDQFGNKLLGSDGKLSDALKEQVLVSSALLGPGEKEQMTFTAPKPGTYTFICGFPGHHSVSKGQLTVR